MERAETEYGLSPAQYHAGGVAKLWAALGKADAGPQDVDVFTQAAKELGRLRAIDDATAKARLYLSVPLNPAGSGSLPEDEHTLTLYFGSFAESQEMACLLLPDCTATALTLL